MTPIDGNACELTHCVLLGAAQGEIMRANKVAFEGKPIHAHKTEGCAKVFHGDCAAGNKVSIAASDLRSSGLLGTPSQYKHDTYAKTKYEEPKYKVRLKAAASANQLHCHRSRGISTKALSKALRESLNQHRVQFATHMPVAVLFYGDHTSRPAHTPLSLLPWPAPLRGEAL